MKRILILSTYPDGGGAALMAYRTLIGLRALGADARMLVAAPVPPEKEAPYIESIGGITWQVLRYLEKLETLIHLRGNRRNLFRFSTASTGLASLIKHPWIRWADVLWIHWVQQSFLSLPLLSQLISLPDKKILWTLHDYWPITGGCHSPYFVDERGETRYCDHFLTGCGSCPLLGPKGSHSGQDISRRLFEHKKALPIEKVTFQAISRMMHRDLSLSPIAQKGQILYLPNFFDPALFYVKEGFPKANRILFAAARPDDPVKGLDLAREALSKAAAKAPELLLVFRFTVVGTPRNDELLKDFPIPVEVIPHATQEELADLYRSATLTLSASRMETFGLTLLESIACGTPVVTFAIDEPSTFVQDGTNGSRVTPFDTEAFAQAILFWCQNKNHLTPRSISDSVIPFRREAVLTTLLKHPLMASAD